MRTFLMIGKYSIERIREASPGHTKLVMTLIEKCGGKTDAIYALLGGYDLVVLAKFPHVDDAMKASYMIGKAAGISFSTYPVIAVEEYNKIIGL